MKTLNHPYPAEKIKVIHVGGTDLEIGRQHAEQVGPSAGKGMATFYYDFWKRMVANAPPGLHGQLFRAATYLVDPILINRLLLRVPQSAQDRIRGISQVIGRPYEQLAAALVLPDLFPMLQAYLVRVKPAGFIDAAPAPRFGCSSFVASGKRFLHGRNLDFPGVAYWDRYPVIQCTRKAGSIPYIGFTTAGVPLGGITGVNEAQISVSLHQHYCRETSLKGALPFVIAEEILSRARTLDEALAILKEARVATSWAFIITDGKKKDAFIYECHPNACGIRFLHEDGKVIAHSNYFQSQECQPSEYATTARMNWDNYWRKTRLEELVRNAGEDLSPAQAAVFISDHYDRYWNEEKVLNRTVSQVYNIQSLVLDPDQMKVWIAAGDAPIHLRTFHEYDLSEIFAGRSGETGNELAGYQFTDQKKALAKESYILSFIKAFDGKYEEAMDGLRQSLKIDFFPEGGQVAGVMSMKLGDFQSAETFLATAKATIEEKVKAKGLTKFPPEYFETSLYLARSRDLLGKRSDAEALYRYISSHADLEDANVQTIAKRARPYRRKSLTKIVMPYSSYIPFE